MCNNVLKFGMAACVLVGLGAVRAEASFIRPLPFEAHAMGSGATPIAMCGFSCRGGGRYIPGPPSVCFARGLNYCHHAGTALRRGRGGDITGRQDTTVARRSTARVATAGDPSKLTRPLRDEDSSSCLVCIG